jgi:hypothetical protein
MAKFTFYVTIAIIIFAIAIGIYLFSIKPGNNSTTIQQNVSPIQLYGPGVEISNVSNIYPVNSSTFYCNDASNCVIIHTAQCFNNLPSQQACINGSDYGAYESAYQNYTRNGTACPEFILAGQASCTCINNGCTLEFTKS